MRTHLIKIAQRTAAMFAATIAGTAILGALAFGTNNTIAQTLLPELILLALSISVITVAMHQVLAYESELPCMSGMMIGMTTGMLSGFLIGFLVGATNGMFVGSLVGIAAGALSGALVGRCCGIMGVMEGVMAGLMAGTMGPMLAVMLLADNYRAFSYLFVALCVGVFGALSVFVEREFRTLGKTHAAARNTTTLALWSIAVTTLIMLIMMLGPHGPLTILTGV
ncbi:MAG: hypothetical protein A3C15_01970 [Candidatus Magasanikbacteria bacterium RIFCSPHIGHO2_02_FULL_50_9b]|uniref:Glycine zipper domain-containing protein n=1 Tax=Candidatus Magasanikbacteria bacterium RIFCSPHIGHO2_02_FULL_50_9b TaxID=1798682 RepID=A0A1F6M942_9BACT|nr:MAG: hypothetical protein A3C15_01970 [Candidatus Magasanikbacteria bacterium RIFCSPHIGHO2_02_FULL_50_9b]